MADSNDSVIVTAKLTKVFRDFWLRAKVTAVADLDMEIEPREVFGLLGPNGSGKSTTLKMILGLMYPTRGRISVLGRRPTDVRVKARIGFLPEESYLYPFLDAWETLDFYGRLFHQPRRERRRRIEMLLDMAGLTRVAYRRVGEYSKGMQRRIGLAQALINDPDLLILDEPTSGMDPIGTRQFKDLIRTLAERGKTVLLSSHLLADVEDVCDRICILYGGRQRAAGSIMDLLAHDERVQITTDSLDAETLERVRGVLASAGRNIIEVATPKYKLETLFLKIVQEAQDQRADTGGAIGTGKVAKFLQAPGRETAGKVLLDRLVKGPEEPQPPPVPRAEPDQRAGPVPSRAGGPGRPGQARPGPRPQAAPAAPRQGRRAPRPAPAADRGVIDKLVGGPGDETKES